METTTASKPSAERLARSTAKSIVSIDGATVRYPESTDAAIDQLTVNIRAGERVGLVGPSGAGKSTILRLCSGLTLATQGKVEIFGVDSRDLGRRAYRSQRSRIGIISQDFSLVGRLRVANNVAAGRLGSRSARQAVATLFRPGPIDEIMQALDQVGIGDKVWDRTDQLSGGQQQRTAIARTLFQGPDLLLADEPVSSLDPARSDSVMAILTKKGNSASTKTVIMSMHDAALALQHCDRIVGLRSGSVQFDLPSADVTDELLDDLYKLDEL